jgi:hypothetical protein
VRSVAAAALISSLAPGCFFVDSINQRPSIAIRQASAEPVQRGHAFTLEAVYDDPDGSHGTLTWSLYACGPAACDAEPYATILAATGDASAGALTAIAPVFLGAQCDALHPTAAACTPVQALRVVLDARDDRGAAARPSQELRLDVTDAAPTLVVRPSDTHGYVRMIPIDLRATYGDADDTPAGVRLEWAVAPAGIALSDPQVIRDPRDDAHLGELRTFTPPAVGQWTIAVTARDAAGAAQTVTVALDVLDDQPPCLAQWQPAVAAPTVLPIAAPSAFAAPVVLDDLDVYPYDPIDPVLGVATFQWSIRRLTAGDATHAPIPGATGSRFVLDPAGFAPGERVELRVEAFDRTGRAPACADAQPTCPVPASPRRACGDAPTQRQTWSLEIR